jgi:hypothetical protein
VHGPHKLPHGVPVPCRLTTQVVRISARREFIECRQVRLVR